MQHKVYRHGFASTRRPGNHNNLSFWAGSLGPDLSILRFTLCRRSYSIFGRFFSNQICIRV